MTYTSADPGHRTPEQKLADKKWRYINSWWIFPSIPSFGMLGWLGFMVAAIRTGQRKYWVFTGVYAALCAAFVTMISIDPDGLISNLAAIPFLGAWFGPTIHAAILNREYLTTLASKGEWYHAPVARPNRLFHQAGSRILPRRQPERLLRTPNRPAHTAAGDLPATLPTTGSAITPVGPARQRASHPSIPKPRSSARSRSREHRNRRRPQRTAGCESCPRSTHRHRP